MNALKHEIYRQTEWDQDCFDTKINERYQVGGRNRLYFMLIPIIDDSSLHGFIKTFLTEHACWDAIQRYHEKISKTRVGIDPSQTSMSF